MSKEKRDERQAERNVKQEARQEQREERRADRTDPDPPDIGRPGGPLNPPGSEGGPSPYPQLPYAPGTNPEDTQTTVTTFPYIGELTCPQDAPDESVKEPLFIQLERNQGNGDFKGCVSSVAGEFNDRNTKIGNDTMSWHWELPRGKTIYVNIDNTPNGSGDVTIEITVKGPKP